MTTLSGHSHGYRQLVHTEPRFAELLGTYGEVDPFIWHDGGRTKGSNFASLVVHIAGQRISAIAAFAVYDRIATLTGGVPTPEQIVSLSFESLRATGLSEAKTRYIRSLAHAQSSGAIDVEHMDQLPDADVIAQLTALPGIGRWSAQMFLIRQLRRRDVLPEGDSGIRLGIQKLWNLTNPVSAAEAAQLAQAWTPYRTYAAALLWRSLAPAGELSDPKERAVAREAAANRET